MEQLKHLWPSGELPVSRIESCCSECRKMPATSSSGNSLQSTTKSTSQQSETKESKEEKKSHRELRVTSTGIPCLAQRSGHNTCGVFAHHFSLMMRKSWRTVFDLLTSSLPRRTTTSVAHLNSASKFEGNLRNYLQRIKRRRLQDAQDLSIDELQNLSSRRDTDPSIILQSIPAIREMIRRGVPDPDMQKFVELLKTRQLAICVVNTTQQSQHGTHWIAIALWRNPDADGLYRAFVADSLHPAGSNNHHNLVQQLCRVTETYLALTDDMRKQLLVCADVSPICCLASIVMLPD